MGRPRLPDEIKRITGTLQRCRTNPHAPAPLPELPIAPAWLNERAAAIFAEVAAILAGLRLASSSDADMLALLASRLDEIEVCTVMIEDGGATYAMPSGERKRHPAVAQRNEAMRHAQRLLAEFGLSPATRARVTARRKPNSPNPFAML